MARESRIPVLVDLTSAPGRTLVFTRTKHGAKALTRQLNAKGVPAVELHGNLSQNARTRNLTAFSEGTAKTLVATDIAARGIHVDDIGLVVHADPPVEHKAYLHRSGRTARAGAAGTVVTLMMDAQVSDVRDLTRKAGIKPTITRLQVGDPLLAEIAPGERTYVEPAPVKEVARQNGSDGSSRGRGSGGRGRSSGGRSGGGRSGGSGGGRSRRGDAEGSRGRSSGGSAGKSTTSRRSSSSSGGSSTVYSSSSHSAASFSSSGRRGR